MHARCAHIVLTVAIVRIDLKRVGRARGEERERASADDGHLLETDGKK